jgi:hypothetical protein
VIVSAWGSQPNEPATPQDGRNSTGIDTLAYAQTILEMPASSVEINTEPDELEESFEATDVLDEDQSNLGVHFIEPDTQKRPKTVPRLPGTASHWWNFLTARDVFFILAGLLLGWVIAILIAYLLFGL